MLQRWDLHTRKIDLMGAAVALHSPATQFHVQMMDMSQSLAGTHPETVLVPFFLSFTVNLRLKPRGDLFVCLFVFATARQQRAL